MSSVAKDQWSIEDLYNAIMQDLEPELMTSNMLGLKEYYKYELYEDRTKREIYYREVLEECFAIMEEILGSGESNLNNIKDSVLSQFKEQEAKKDNAKMHDLELLIEGNIS